MPTRATQEVTNGLACCAQCGVPADQRCSRCRQVYYCGRDHQKEHWAAHRALCFPYKVARDNILGRHLVAASDLPAGACVLREEPVATGPPPALCTPVCVACYKTLDAASSPGGKKKAAPLCPRGCGWPVCGPHCANHPRHKPECDLQRSRSGDPLDVLDALAAGRPVHRALTVARCLLLKVTAPATYARLRTFEAHCARRKASGQWEEERQTLAKFMLPFFGLEGRFSEDDVLYMAGVLQINTYPVRVSDPPPFVAIYNEASFIEHACVPNTAKVFSADGDLLLRTVTPVPKGHHLSICYVEASLGTGPRRANLKEELLECRCSRCVDASEFGTAFSALTCHDDQCSGAVLPEHPVCEDCSEDTRSGGPWRCTCCGNRTEAAEVASLLNVAAKAAASMSPSELLANARCLRLGSSHYLLLPARVAITASVADTPCQRTEFELHATERQLRELRQLVDKILPAEVGLRGQILFSQHAVLWEKEKRCARSAGVSAEDLSPHLVESKKLLQEAVSLLRDHAPTSAEGRLYERAKRVMDTFASFHETSLPKINTKEVSVNGTPSANGSSVTAASLVS